MQSSNALYPNFFLLLEPLEEFMYQCLKNMEEPDEILARILEEYIEVKRLKVYLKEFRSNNRLQKNYCTVCCCLKNSLCQKALNLQMVTKDMST